MTCMTEQCEQLKRAIEADEAEFVARWLSCLRRIVWPLGDGADTNEQLKQRCTSILSALRETLDAETIEPLGEPQWRETLQLFGFTAGWMAGEGMPVSMALGLVSALEEVSNARATLVVGRVDLFRQLQLASVDAYARCAQQQADARLRALVERSQVVCELPRRLPALFLVGEPDRGAIESAVGRLATLSVMTQSPVVVVDSAALSEPEKVLAQVTKLWAQFMPRQRPALLVAGESQSLAAWARAERTEAVRVFPCIAEAISAATMSPRG